MIKYFIVYYVISGVLTAHYSQRHYKDIVEKYPQIEMFNYNFILLFQFSIGFIMFPLWAPVYIRDFIVKIISRRVHLPTATIRIATQEEIEKHNQQQNKADAEIIEKYKNSIEDLIEMKDRKIKSISTHGEECTMQQIKASILYDFTFSFTDVDDKIFIMINEDFFSIVFKSQAHLMHGWETACIISNPFKHD